LQSPDITYLHRDSEGGLYSSSSDMSKFLRFVLQNYNGLVPEMNWFQPSSYSTTISSFYGTPWEIFRTNSILNTTSRPITFVTKSGSVPGYLSYIILLPEYDLGITILTTGTTTHLKDIIREKMTNVLVKEVEQIAQDNLATRYAGVYSAQNLNSTLVISQSPIKNLFMESFISNGTDFMSIWNSFLQDAILQVPSFRTQLIPTLLYRDEQNQRGEIWRGIPVPEKGKNPADWFVWDDHCITNDDSLIYGGKPALEIVFWDAEDGDGRIVEAELSAFRVTLTRENHSTTSQLGDQVVLKQDL
jgi:hypothetical protein